MLDLYVYSIKIEGNDMAALSFLTPETVTQYGLPAEAVLGEVDPKQSDMTVDGFVANEAFLTFMHAIVAELAGSLEKMKGQAKKVGNGPVYVMDYRSLNSGEKPPFEDVIGWFGARDGEIVPDSYNSSPKYKLLTNAGPIALEPSLEAELLKRVNALLGREDQWT